MKTKIFKKFLVAIGVLLILGVIILLIREYAPKQISFESLNKSTKNANLAQGNYLLVSRKNGIGTFPVFWGEGLYLYSIEQNRFYLVKVGKVPLQTFDDLISTVQGNKIYYTKGFASPGQEVFMKDFSHISKEEMIVEAVDYAVTDRFIYYMNDSMDNVEICRREIGTGEDFQIAKGAITYMIIDDENLYYYDEKKKMIDRIRSSDGQKTEFSNVKSAPVWIGTGQNNHVLVLDEEGKFFQIEANTHERQTISRLKGTLNIYTNYKYSHPYFYYDNDEYELYRIDTTNGEQKKIIDLYSIDGIKQYLSNGPYTYINYCKDYITIEFVYENESMTKEYRKFLIFDFDGNLILTKKI